MSSGNANNENVPEDIEMSQEKVDKRKYEKYHRKEIQRKQKIKATIGAVIFVLILGTAIGIPLGYKIYDSIPKKISSLTFNAWVSSYVKDIEGYPFVIEQEDNTDEDSTGEDATGQDSTGEDATDQDNTGEDVDSKEDSKESSENTASEEASDTTKEAW